MHLLDLLRNVDNNRPVDSDHGVPLVPILETAQEFPTR